MEFRLSKEDQELLLPLAKRLSHEIESMIQTGVLHIEEDKDLGLIQHAAVVRSDMLLALRKRKESQQYLSLAKRIRKMRTELARKSVKKETATKE